MVVKRSGLGKNLAALLSQSHLDTVLEKDRPVLEYSPTLLPIEVLQPGKYQPRGEMDEEGLKELTESIIKQGLLQPLVVREVSSGHYEIIAGERRWRACQLAGKTHIPVIIRQVDDESAMALALIENLQREDLNIMDQARAMHRLITEFSLTHQQIAELLCKSRTAVSNALRLLNLSLPVRQLLENGDLDMGHARCLLVLNEEQQYHVAQLIVAKNLSVRETEALVNRIKMGNKNKEKPPSTHFALQENVQTLIQHLQTKVRIKEGKGGKGLLILQYKDYENLEYLMNCLMK